MLVLKRKCELKLICFDFASKCKHLYVHALYYFLYLYIIATCDDGLNIFHAGGSKFTIHLINYY